MLIIQILHANYSNILCSPLISFNCVFGSHDGTLTTKYCNISAQMSGLLLSRGGVGVPQFQLFTPLRK